MNLKLWTTAQEMSFMMSTAIAAEINKRIESRLSEVKEQVQSTLKERIIKSPEYLSLMGDSSTSSLRAHFGLISPTSVVTPIIDTWLKNIQIVFKKFQGTKGNKIRGTFKINAIGSSYLDVKSLPTASYTSKPSNQLIPWLEWLLESGTTLLIKDYGITFDINTGVFQGLFKSRSGSAIMINKETTFGMSPLHGSFTWSVPPQYAGTKDDNWITRALANIEPEISKIFMGIFK